MLHGGNRAPVQYQVFNGFGFIVIGVAALAANLSVHAYIWIMKNPALPRVVRKWFEMVLPWPWQTFIFAFLVFAACSFVDTQRRNIRFQHMLMAGAMAAFFLWVYHVIIGVFFGFFPKLPFSPGTIAQAAFGATLAMLIDEMLQVFGGIVFAVVMAAVSAFCFYSASAQPPLQYFSQFYLTIIGLIIAYYFCRPE